MKSIIIKQCFSPTFPSGTLQEWGQAWCPPGQESTGSTDFLPRVFQRRIKRINKYNTINITIRQMPVLKNVTLFIIKWYLQTQKPCKWKLAFKSCRFSCFRAQNCPRIPLSFCCCSFVWCTLLLIQAGVVPRESRVIYPHYEALATKKVARGACC